MRLKLLVGVFIAAIAVGGWAYDSYISEPEAIPREILATKPVGLSPSELPKVRLTSFSGQKFTVNDLKEPIILLNFWASWCGICMAEMPDIVKLIEEMDGKVALVTVSIDDSLPPAEKFKQSLIDKDLLADSHIYWAWDENKEVSLNQFNVAKTPETIVIDQHRRMVDKVVGNYDWQGKAIRELINAL